MNTSILILTHNVEEEALLPHYHWVKKTNPNADIHIIVGEDSPFGKSYNWKNGDVPLIKWWRENASKVRYDDIFICEWDTLVGCELPKLPNHLDLAGKQLMHENPTMRYKWKQRVMYNPFWSEEYWWWWNEIPLLELPENETAIGLISFGALFTRRWVLDAVADIKWNHLFEKSIQNELRFPTIAKLCGASVGTIDLPFVTYKKRNITKTPGIYHAIKKPFE